MIDINDIADKTAIRKWASLFSGKLFAMIAVYADETGTGGIPKAGKEPAPGVYGFLATPEAWEAFRANWKSMLDKYSVPYFHFRELSVQNRAKKKNPYFGWNGDRVDDFIYDMAFVASSGPIPFGGHVSVKKLYGPKPTNVQLNKSYRKAFYQFFTDFKDTMNGHFPNESGKASFFFSDIDNETWILMLNQVIKDVRNHDARIGEFSFINNKDYRGIPCQAADLFAYVNRQSSSNMYEAGTYLSLRVLDVIIGRYAYPKNNPGYGLRGLTNEKWRELIEDMHKEKKRMKPTNQRRITIDLSHIILFLNNCFCLINQHEATRNKNHRGI